MSRIILVEGHGLVDVGCSHGSRWKWWSGPDGQGAWMNVVLAPKCECGDPPRPYREGAKK